MNLLLLCLILLAYVFFTGKKIIYGIHMLQQNSYMNHRYVRWLQANKKQLLSWQSVLLFLPLLCFFAAGSLPGTVYHQVVLASVVIVYGVLGVLYHRPAEKKKLVYTARVKRVLATAFLLLVVFTLFCLVLFMVDYDLLAILLLAFFHMAYFLFVLCANAIMKPVEDHINMGFFRDAQRMIEGLPHLTKIGLTGSFGKTSSKFILGQVLEEQFNVLVSPESYNTPMGLTRVIRERLRPTHEVFVAEMGAKRTGDIAELCQLVAPKIGIITAIGEQHLETFGSLENIKHTKFELVHQLPADGFAILNGDDENTVSMLDTVTCPFVLYGITGENLDYRATDIQFTGQGMSFTVHNKKGDTCTITTKLLGRHNIYNILAAVACGDYLGMPLTKIAQGVKRVEPVPHRLEIKKSAANFTIIDDAFNSNPVGSKSALEVLGQIAGNKKIIITPGMVELGEREYELNKEFAKACAAVCDFVILVGKKHSLPLQDGLKEVKMPENKYFVAADLYEASRKLTEIVGPGDVVLYENDLPDTYNE